MDAFEAIPLLQKRVEELEAAEGSWKNCRACPFSGKCCDGAPLILFPEEADAIAEHLRDVPDVLEFALSRFKRGKKCYFYDKESSKCRIHNVRPLNCRWTPYVAFQQADGSHLVHLRDANCGFTDRRVAINPGDDGIISLEPSTLKEGENTKYLSWQSMLDLRPLMLRANEMIELEVLMSKLAT